MSIEQKIAEILAESKAAALEQQVADEQETVVEEEVVAEEAANPDNAKNDVDTEKTAETSDLQIKGVKEDIDALMNGEELSEEFRAKATTIYEAAVTARVKAEVTRIEEEYATKLEEEVAEIAEGLVEKVDGYLDYVVEQWIAQNEIALEHGMKSEILEGFVAGLKGLFEEHYIDIPEEKFDVLGSMESKVEELEARLNEQVASNVELNKTIGELKRNEIVETACEGLTDTEVEKLKGLAEELSYEDSDTFKTKVQTIRENYFTTKQQAEVTSVVTDEPVETLTEEKKIDPTMAKYLSALNYRK